jgi:hypothetical protein
MELVWARRRRRHRNARVLEENPQVWRALRQGNITLIHSVPTSCCGCWSHSPQKAVTPLAFFVAFSKTNGFAKRRESGFPIA